MSEVQSNLTETFQSFADWCRHKDHLSPAAKHTVEVLLREAGTTDCHEAELILMSRTKLNLHCNQITDLNPLSTLTNLTELYLHNNQITDINPLSTLTNLSKLNIRLNQIVDYLPLSVLTNLTELYLEANEIKDLKLLSTLTNLTKLYLEVSQIKDLSPLSTLSNLTELYLHNNQITDLSPLSTLTNLTELYLHNNQIKDLSPLSTLSNLTYLYLEGSQITDLSPLQSLNSLEYCEIYNVTLPKKYFLPLQKWQSKWILEEKNIGIRRVLIQQIGYDRICQELQATELDTWREYTLLKIDIFDDFDIEDDRTIEATYLLKMTCPTTGYIHALRVPPNLKSAREAIRWVNWGIDPEEFAMET
ncbi:leucine-rich repeat domain-containing protein [Aerosakkonemataceae cyanobacterium BLCC-F50]|uniref:Leucine-rich repeat domain-containing protein n=1 Tax=Floridaenema flaviceps BLCC-F50 TaxID=3153642 RepID=A0ABV4Y1Q9_9CYAN